MTNYDITIISDTVCPFCYLGRARLNRTIALYRKTVPGASGSTFTIHWHAYQLKRAALPFTFAALNTPAAAATSISVRDVAADRFGADRLPAKIARMKQLGESEGFNFTFEGRIGNTRDSHRVAHLGRKLGGWELEDKVMVEMMRMFFEEGGDITSWEDLGSAAERAGIEKDVALRWLEDGEGGEEVDQEVREAEAMGVQGVPRFVIDGKYEVEGADDVTAFFEQLLKAKEDKEGGGDVVA